MSTRTGIAATEFARLANVVVDELGPSLAEALRTHPVRTVADEFDLTVEPMTVGVEATCGVAGRYYEDQQRIVYDPSASAGRRSFTVLHELGHALAYLHDDVADYLEAVALEEADEDFCDAFAAALLLPDDLVGRHVGKRGPTAADVAALAADSTASREACAVAAAQRLPGSGYVVVARTDGTVQFAARTRTPYRIARDTAQPGSVLAEAGTEGRSRAASAVLRYRSGQPTDPHAADAVRADGYVFGVFTTGRPPWESALWIPPDDGPSSTDASCVNPACGHEWTAFGRPCTGCGDHRCPECGRCGCDLAEPDETRCDGCGFLVASARVVDGRCNDCR